MHCLRCQAATRPGLRFCTQCGASLALACGRCNGEVLSGDRFCGHCGTTLAVPSSAAQPQQAPGQAEWAAALAQAPSAHPPQPAAPSEPAAPPGPSQTEAALRELLEDYMRRRPSAEEAGAEPSPPEGVEEALAAETAPEAEPEGDPELVEPSVAAEPEPGPEPEPEPEPVAPPQPVAPAAPRPAPVQAAADAARDGAALEPEPFPEESAARTAALLSRVSPHKMARAKAESVERSQGERTTATILMLDVSGFTSMSERLEIDEVAFVMNEWNDRLVGIIVQEYDGWIIKTMGDGVMATFGAPIAVDNAPERAVRAALDIQEAIGSFEVEGLSREELSLRVRVGIHSGDVVAGGVMADGVRKFDVLGSAVNIASRLETNAPVGGILVSDAVYRRVSELFECEPVGALQLKNVSEPVEAYVVKSSKERTSRIGVAERRGMVRLVGRDTQLDQLQSALEKAMAGSGQVVSVVGEAGVGKSRLAYELRRSMEEDEVHWLEGHCLSFGANRAYLPLQDMFRGWAGIQEFRDDEEVQRRKLAAKLKTLGEEAPDEYAPPLGEMLSIPFSHTWWDKVPAEQRPEEMLGSIQQFLLALAAQKPVVVMLDDLQWMDPSSEALVERLIPAIQGHPVLLVLCHRPQYAPSWSARHHGKIILSRLSQIESDQLLSELAGDRHLNPALRETVLYKAEGNPFYLEEFVRTVLAEVDARGDGQIDLSDIPDTVQEMIDARLDRLSYESDKARAFLNTGAIRGARFAGKLVQRVAKLSDSEYLEAIRLLVRQNFLVPLEQADSSDATGDVEFVFEHNLTHERVVSRIVTRERKNIHSEIVTGIEQVYAGQLERYADELAYHCGEAGRYAEAVDHHVTAAERNLKAAAFLAVIEGCTTALGILEDLDHPRKSVKEADFHIIRAHAHAWAGSIHEALADSKRGLELAMLARDPETEARAYERIGFACFRLGEFERAKQYYRLAETVYDAIGQTSHAAGCRQGVIAILHDTGDYEAARRAYEQEITLLRANPDPGDDRREELSLVINLGSSLEKLGEYEGALKRFLEADQICRELEDNLGRGYMTANIGELQFGMGRHREALEYFENALRIFKSLSDRNMTGFITKDVARVKVELAEYQEALRHARDAQGIGVEVEAEPLQVEAMVAQAAANLYMGLLDSSHEVARNALDLARKVGHTPAEADCAVLSGRVALERGDDTEALRGFTRALQRSREMKNRRAEAEALTGHGKVYLARADWQAAVAAFDQAIDTAEHMGARRVMARALLGLGDALEHQGDGDGARRAFERALALGEEMPHPRTVHDAAANVARSKRRAGDRQGALDLFVKAMTVARKAARACGPFAQRSLAAQALAEIQIQTISLLWEMGAVEKPAVDIDGDLLALIEGPTPDPEVLRKRSPELDSLTEDLLRRSGIANNN